jgi:hypothetical protein
MAKWCEHRRVNARLLLVSDHKADYYTKETWYYQREFFNNKPPFKGTLLPSTSRFMTNEFSFIFRSQFFVSLPATGSEKKVWTRQNIFVAVTERTKTLKNVFLKGKRWPTVCEWVDFTRICPPVSYKQTMYAARQTNY